jgi:endonuclease/exonuclease/phosphatase family metal-dependent hydrolase
LTTVELDHQYLDVFTTYLDNVSERARYNQIQALVKIVNREKSTIIMGDLNSIDPREHIHLSKLNLSFKHKSHELIFEKLPKVVRMFTSRVIPYLKSNGFTDGAEIKTPTIPTALSEYPFQQAVLRLDYAFYRGRVEILGLTVPHDAIFEQASDHYPIVFKVKIT